MNKLILTAAIAAAIVTPSIALAQTADAGPMLCHTAKSSETSNAAMGTTKLVCRAIDVAKVRAAEKSMMSMMPKTMTDAQTKAMKSDQATFDLEFGLPMILGGGTQSDR